MVLFIPLSQDASRNSVSTSTGTSNLDVLMVFVFRVYFIG
jgi:hypothetical protein